MTPPVLCQTYGYLPSRRALLLFDKCTKLYCLVTEARVYVNYTIQYDTTSYIYMRPKADISQLNLRRGTGKTEKIRKRNWNKNRYAHKKLSVQESVESVLRKEQSLWWEGFVKQVGFKPTAEARGQGGQLTPTFSSAGSSNIFWPTTFSCINRRFVHFIFNYSVSKCHHFLCENAPKSSILHSDFF